MFAPFHLDPYCSQRISCNIQWKKRQSSVGDIGPSAEVVRGLGGTHKTHTRVHHTTTANTDTIQLAKSSSTGVCVH